MSWISRNRSSYGAKHPSNFLQACSLSLVVVTANPVSSPVFIRYGPRRKDHIDVGSSGYQAFQPQETAQAATADLKWSFAERIPDVNVLSGGNIIFDIFSYAVSGRCVYRVLVEIVFEACIPKAVSPFNNGGMLQPSLPNTVGRRLHVQEPSQLGV